MQLAALFHTLFNQTFSTDDTAAVTAHRKPACAYTAVGKDAAKVEKKSIFSSILPSQDTVEQPKSNVREYMQRPADDIDSRDASNPLLVTEYADRMYDHFRIIESKFRVNGNYMKSVQSHIKYVLLHLYTHLLQITCFTFIYIHQNA